MKNTASASKGQSTTANKSVTVLFRVQIKSSQDVIYRVRNGEDREYLITISANGNTGCTACADNQACPSTKRSRKCYHIKACLKLEESRVVVKVGDYPVSGATASHAVAKALRLVQSRQTIADVDVVAQACEVVEELPLLPAIEEVAFDNDPFEEAEVFTEDVAEQWTEQEIAVIRAAALAPKIPVAVPTRDYSQRGNLNGNRGFNVLLHQ